MICSDKELSVMDENLSKAFKEAIQTTKDKNQLKNKQFTWLKERNECKDLKISSKTLDLVTEGMKAACKKIWPISSICG